jgi:hypothetical protein
LPFATASSASTSFVFSATYFFYFSMSTIMAAVCLAFTASLGSRSLSSICKRFTSADAFAS